MTPGLHSWLAAWRPALARLLALMCVLLAGAFAQASDLQAIPALNARVTDTTGTLSAQERSALDTRLAALERDKGTQVAVLLVDTTAPEPIEAYALRVAEQWRLGRKGVDDGVLLLVALKDRRLRIEVGYGLEGALNDATAKRIIAETITPAFRAGHIGDGIAAGAEQIARVVAGEPLPPPPKREGSFAPRGMGFPDLFIVALVLVTIGAKIIGALFGRFFGAVVVGGIAGAIIFWLMASLLLAGIGGFVAFIVALLAGGIGGGIGGSGGGFGGGFGGGGFGGGGFSGGGGSFGGGGASGSW